MKIIYDEERAKKRAKRSSVLTIVGASVFVASLVLLIVGVVADSLALGIIGGIPVAIFYGVSLFTPRRCIPIRLAKNSDISYFLLSQKYEIKEVKVEERFWEKKKKKILFLTVNFIAEDKEGNIENVFEGILEEKMNTKVEEDTLDLEKGILYRPYKKEEGEEK